MNGRKVSIGLSVMLALVALVVAAFALSEAGSIEAGDVQTMSVSGYLFAVEDGTGTVQFSVSDAGAVVMNGAATLSAGADLDGQQLTLDADQDSFFSELADDSIGFTPGAASGSLEVRTGNLQVGDGSPGETHDGEDFYVEDISEFDGNAYFDGQVDFDAVTDLVTDTEHIGLMTIDAISVITTTDGAIATVTDGEVWFVSAVYCHVTTNFDCTGDDCILHIGDGNDEDGLLDLDDGELQTTDTEITGAQAGWQGMYTDTTGAYLSGTSMNGFVYAPSGADETVDILIEDSSDNSNPTSGAATCYIVYTRVE